MISKNTTNESIPPSLEDLFRNVGEMDNYFGNPSIMRLQLDQRRIIQPDRKWSPRVLFALVLRKYLFRAFLWGTERLFRIIKNSQDSLNMKCE